jgi:hypothetical protein
MAIRSICDAGWSATVASVLLVLGACGAPWNIEPAAGSAVDPTDAPAVDEPQLSRSNGEFDPARLADEPGETIEHPVEFSAAVFVPVEFVDLDLVTAELWPQASGVRQEGVTFVAFDRAFEEPESMESMPGESAVADFDAWDRVEAPERPQFDELDLARVSPDT